MDRQAADTAARDADRQRELRRRQVAVDADNLRLSGQGGAAAAAQIQADLKTKLVEAAGDPDRERLVREEALVKAREAQTSVLARGPNRGERLDNFSASDLTNKAADPGRQLDILVGLAKGIRDQLKNPKKQPATAG